MYNTSKYYSYIFYADRNVRPWTILGYTLATFPKVAINIYLCTTQEEIKTLAQLQEKGPCTAEQVDRKINSTQRNIDMLKKIIEKKQEKDSRKKIK